MLFIILSVIGIILWKTGNAKMRRAIAYTAMGLATAAFLYTASQFNTSQNNSVVVQSEGVIEGDINDHKHEKQQYVP
ncbi:hypothetical protein NDS46_16390 [Paenibacillus thiaminolyticus]|uniref:hypothetical protein n=1 Tax=Paenibacillus thiaminolyticus TaxID=49283 RepID=UPI00232E10AD|nr:hypothetical protein [Paenibacillus thiaminolyticus]WCF05952.1 hypothetical protein NDS46_16390 [Paenibacillus thiaminolyticus]